MKTCSFFVASALLVFTATAVSGQVENPDFRIRAKFRTPKDAPWGPDESVGNADFRVKSRFLQIYYGGVVRSDDYKFQTQFDFTDISGFDTEFLTSPYNNDLDVFINDDFVGRVLMNVTDLGIGELKYDSRNPTPPATLLPVDFPNPVNVFDTVRVFEAAPTLPNIADPLPSGAPLFLAELIEKFARGDANQDGKVDEDDFEILSDSYDPFHILGPHVGPVAGDFTGDNLSDIDDYNLVVNNWTDSSDVPLEPAAIALPTPLLPGDINEDQVVDRDDFRLFVPNYGAASGSTIATGDFNDDGATSLTDLIILQAHLDHTLAPSVAVPEPSSIILLLLALSAGGLRLRRRGAKSR